MLILPYVATRDGICRVPWGRSIPRRWKRHRCSGVAEQQEGLAAEHARRDSVVVEPERARLQRVHSEEPDVTSVATGSERAPRGQGINLQACFQLYIDSNEGQEFVAS